MTTLLLVRHGRTEANANGTLAGRSPGVGLDATGKEQATALGERMAGLTLSRIVVSPLERCQQTAEVVFGQRRAEQYRIDDRLTECDYGTWTGRALKELADEPLWARVQNHPSSVVFPEGEALADVAARGVGALRDHDRQVVEQCGPNAVWAVVTHGDLIKSVLADALGMHVDLFQRIVVDPCSVSALRYTSHRPFVLRVNDVGGDLRSFEPKPEDDGAQVSESDAAVGGGTGTTSSTT